MQGRIGTLHVRYQVAPSSRFGSAIVPGISRTLEQELAQAVDVALERAFGTGEEVVVIREASMRLRLDSSQWSVGGRLVDAFSRATSDAVVDVLAAPAPDTVARFEDQAEFVGSFISDLCDGSAWDRWCYGAFAGYRDADTARTIAQVLKDNEACAARALAWLARRGRLDRVMALLGSSELRQATGGIGRSRPWGNDSGALIHVGLRLLEAMGYDVRDESLRRVLSERYRASAPIDATWTDRRSLSAWVLNFVRFAMPDLPSGIRDDTAIGERVAALLGGSLDWLDAAWLQRQLGALMDGASVEGSTPSVLPRSSNELLQQLAELVRRGGVRLLPGEGVDATVVRVTAALGGLLPPGGTIDRVTQEAVARIVAALFQSDGAGRAEARRVAGSAGEALLDALRQPESHADRGMPSAAGGLYLFTRAIMDTGLLGLAGRLGIPRAPLLGSLARSLLGLEPPLDIAAALWVGDPNPDPIPAQPDGALEQLRIALAEIVVAQGGGEPLPDTAGIAELLGRAWCRWMPGFADASLPFLVEKCLRRATRIHMTDGTISVHLEPAPLDVVLDMAGYLQPIDQVSWLGNRRVVFHIVGPRG